MSILETKLENIAKTCGSNFSMTNQQ